MRAVYILPLVFIIVFMLSINSVDAVTINNPNLPLVQSEPPAAAAINNNSINVNNSALLQGLTAQQVANLYQENTTWHYNQTSAGSNLFLNLSGTNANQNIKVYPYNFTAQRMMNNFTFIDMGSVVYGTLNFTAVPSSVGLLVRKSNAGSDTAAISIRAGAGSTSHSTLYMDTGEAETNWLRHFESSSTDSNIKNSGWEIIENSTVALFQGNYTTTRFGSTGLTQFTSLINKFGTSSTCTNGVTCSLDLESGAFGVHKQSMTYSVSSGGVTAKGTIGFRVLENFGVNATPFEMIGMNSTFYGYLSSKNNSYFYAPVVIKGDTNITGIGNFSVEGTIMTLKNYSVNNIQGITKNLNMLNASNVSCFQNFTGGILTWTSC